MRGALRNFAFVGILLLLLGAVTPQNTPQGPLTDHSRRVNQFTFDLLRAIAQEQSGNTLVSAPTLYQTLAMSYVASDGLTRTQLEAALHFPSDNPTLIAQLAHAREALLADARKGRTSLHLASASWLDDSHAAFHPDYKATLGLKLSNALFPARFNNAAAASDRINRWVADQTDGRIKSVVTPDTFKSRSSPGRVDEPALVSISAASFHAAWVSRFDTAQTRDRPFNVAPEQYILTPTMQQRGLFAYAENDSFQLLELPYRGGYYSMLIILPRSLSTLRETLQLLQNDSLSQLRTQTTSCDVDLQLPKFTTQTRLDAKQVLSTLGVSHAFNPDLADFNRMIKPSPEAFRIYLSTLTHDGWIEVSETGTKAAAVSTATHYSVGCSASPKPKKVTFHADHPFLYFIVHNPTQTHLFAGWLAQPK